MLTTSPYLWFLQKERVLFQGKGLYSDLTVTKRGSRVNLYSGGKGFLQTTYDPQVIPNGTHLNWYLSAPLFSGNFTGNLNSMLILGLGGGAQVKLYNRFYNVNKITAIEIDPLIIELGEKYFDLNDTNLEIVNADACEYLKLKSEKKMEPESDNKGENNFDLIIIDVFKEDMFEESCQSEDILTHAKNLLTENGVLFINKLISDDSNAMMEAHLKKLFTYVYTMKMQYTLFYIGTNSKDAPISVIEIKNLLFNFSNGHHKLSFFKNKIDITN